MFRLLKCSLPAHRSTHCYMKPLYISEKNVSFLESINQVTKAEVKTSQVTALYLKIEYFGRCSNGRRNSFIFTMLVKYFTLYLYAVLVLLADASKAIRKCPLECSCNLDEYLRYQTICTKVTDVDVKFKIFVV
uniref:Uncharacterized protein n=1 Tax=Glossina palpalis gambiensis TaxID=67801 RepID=A0A1B0APZ6_9MUSC